ncbi:hypothetical protein ACLF3G_23335 [Falsiroseomonas sp. HC035]|uniref:hypothetical protein n=1 Tax=Falsiroseomonas sp. HC035 TaxID=3390999 RepID=UPI003D3136F5
MTWASWRSATARFGETTRRIDYAIAALLLATAPAAAQESVQTVDSWRFSLTPYMWFSGVSGEVALPRESRDVEADFGDILSSLQIGAMGIFEARRGRFGLVVDAMTLTTEQDVSTPRGVLFNGGTSRMTATELSMVGLVRVGETPSWSLDLGAGLRGWWIDSKLSLNSGVAAARSASGTANVLDPLLAVRYKVNLAERIGFSTYVDIGGFKTGSRLTWQVIAALDWQATDRITAHLGYRHIEVELSRGAVDLDIALSGPIIGGTFRF